MARKNLGKILPEYRHGKLVKRNVSDENSSRKPKKFSRKNDEYLTQLTEKFHAEPNEKSRKNLRQKELENYLLEMPNSWLDFPFDEKTAVYKTRAKNGDEKMFALIPLEKNPLQISLKCDPELAKDLREKYESVLPGFHLNKKHWITILLTGQVDDELLKDLVRLSWRLAGRFSENVENSENSEK